MNKTLIIYGSTTGTCERIAGLIGEKLGVTDIVSASEVTVNQINEAQTLLLGTSTWGVGDIQDDWYTGLETLKSADLTGKTVAIFGVGDSCSFSDSFCGGMADLYHAAIEGGATIIGQVSTDDYTFGDSAAVIDGQFVGLALDETNEEHRTEGRIDTWLAAIKES